MKRYQGSPEWLEERRGGIGSSDLPVLMGGDRDAWLRLFAQKLGILPDDPGNETMRWGHLLEDVIARAYTEQTGHRVQRVQRILRHPELDHVRASLDRRRPGAVVELKKWGFKGSDFGAPGSDQVPDAMAYQVQQQLAVTGLPIADLAVLFAGQKLEVFTLGRDQGTIDGILALETRLWGYVQRGEIPPWPGPAPIRPILSEGEIEANGMMNEAVTLLLAAREAIASLEKNEAELEGILRELLADAPGARGDGFRISYRPNKDSVRVAWQQVALAYRKAALERGADPEQLDAIESLFTSTSPGARPLRISREKGALVTS